MRVYIAGPMAGIPQHNFPAFAAAAVKLIEAGHQPVSPADGVDPDIAEIAEMMGMQYRETKMYKNFLRLDLKLVLDCDAIQLLEGWEKSRGAQLEVHVARAVGIEVWEPNV